MKFREILLVYKSLISFNLLSIIAFTSYFLMRSNHEFILYVGVLIFFFVLILATIEKTRFSGKILWGLSIWGFLHLAGGSIQIDEGKVLYDWVIWPVVSIGEDWIFRYDQAVHIYGFAAATFVGAHLIKAQLRENYKPNSVAFLAFIIGMGFGALNEVIEFAAEVFIPDTNVGGYVNTGLDMVSNFIGAAIAALIVRTQDRGRV